MVCVCPRFDRTLGRSQKVLNGSIRVSGITGTTPGADIVAVKELLGHKSMQMTLRYAHLAPDYWAPGVHGALQNEVPMVVMSGESQTLGEDPDLDIEQQWYGGLTVGGIERFVEPVAKWARAVTGPNETMQIDLGNAGNPGEPGIDGVTYLADVKAVAGLTDGVPTGTLGGVCTRQGLTARQCLQGR